MLERVSTAIKVASGPRPEGVPELMPNTHRPIDELPQCIDPRKTRTARFQIQNDKKTVTKISILWQEKGPQPQSSHGPLHST